eukprot:GHVR01057639.1.p1 GENE.GHVR01057639.1~~GHVR01057639.1.p1  ORF type:complete len:104 (+),score=31.91 GHVR01057639.1:154-465(+)
MKWKLQEREWYIYIYTYVSVLTCCLFLVQDNDIGESTDIESQRSSAPPIFESPPRRYPSFTFSPVRTVIWYVLFIRSQGTHTHKHIHTQTHTQTHTLLVIMQP